MRFTALTLEAIIESATDAVEFVFLPAQPLSFRPGQGGLIVVPGGGAKPFTFASDNRTGRISIATMLRSGSRFKRALGVLRPGDRVHAVGAIGSLPAVDPAESQVFVAQGIGITPFLAMARSHGSVNATLLHVGAPHFFDEVAAATNGNAEHHAHREGLQAAVDRTMVSRPAARWVLSGRPDFVAAVGTQLAEAGVPARTVHKATFWGMHNPAPRHDLVPA
ncbi:FAD-dependent oxidoreductase [Sinomonas sp. ASV322]|uniref:FAD-dependent oxidoreductase n=1 Tax=Sinomonas sp. ASV322 TaxID=3041920 RepID=UPI0027DD0C58|nr:FAD-dependent oxidoreductase [Sinomonas sp. ASV322]MDQ4503059.1 FAD-dependent oxidoreductase [Sinomonas sp. ASV322]